MKRWTIQYRNTGCNVIRSVIVEKSDTFGKRDVQQWFNSNSFSLKYKSLKHLGFPDHVFGYYRIRDFVNCWLKKA